VGESLILRRAGGRDCSVRHDLGRGEERKAHHRTFWSPAGPTRSAWWSCRRRMV